VRSAIRLVLDIDLLDKHFFCFCSAFTFGDLPKGVSEDVVLCNLAEEMVDPSLSATCSCRRREILNFSILAPVLVESVSFAFVVFVCWFFSGTEFDESGDFGCNDFLRLFLVFRWDGVLLLFVVVLVEIPLRIELCAAPENPDQSTLAMDIFMFDKDLLPLRACPFEYSI